MCYLWWKYKSSSLFSFCFGHSWARQGKARQVHKLQLITAPTSNKHHHHHHHNHRHEICQKIYIAGFSGQKFYTLNFDEFQQLWWKTTLYGKGILQRFPLSTNISVKNMLRPAVIFNMSDRTGTFHTDKVGGVGPLCHGMGVIFFTRSPQKCHDIFDFYILILCCPRYCHILRLCPKYDMS